MIKLENLTRKNRIFYDSFIREIIICLAYGDKKTNRDLMLASYVNHKHGDNVSDPDNYFQLNRDTGCTFKPIKDVVSKKTLDAIDEMLSNANLAPCFDLTKLKQYLKEQSDLSDSSLSAANGMFERIIKMA